jgi:hypothetical protein
MSKQLRQRNIQAEQKESKTVCKENEDCDAEYFLRSKLDINEMPKHRLVLEAEKIAEWMEEYRQQGQPEKVNDEPYVPYFGWCDVNGCKNEGCCGVTGWSKTGYWTLCRKHSQMARGGKKQPKMKQSAIERESRRDKNTGYLIPKR